MQLKDVKPSEEFLIDLHSYSPKCLLQCQPSSLPRAGQGPQPKLRLHIDVITEYHMGGSVADDKT